MSDQGKRRWAGSKINSVGVGVRAWDKIWNTYLRSGEDSGAKYETQWTTQSTDSLPLPP